MRSKQLGEWHHKLPGLLGWLTVSLQASEEASDVTFLQDFKGQLLRPFVREIKYEECTDSVFKP